MITRTLFLILAHAMEGSEGFPTVSNLTESQVMGQITTRQITGYPLPSGHSPRFHARPFRARQADAPA